jgi:hypothetical protein
MRTVISAILLVSLAVSPYAAAQGTYVPAISVAQAEDIAVVNGVIAIRKIEFNDGAWKVEGRDREGRRVEVKIDPGTGEIIRLERYY